MSAFHRKFKVGLAALAIMFMGREVPASPGRLELAGWLVYWDKGDSLADFQRHAALMARVCPAWYVCGSDGLPARQDEATPGLRQQTLAIARRAGVKVLALINNFNKGDFDAARVEKFLKDPALMARHVAQLVAMAKQDRADGLDVDIECLRLGDREAYSRYIESLAAACHAQGLLLAVAVHPKTAEPGSWDGDQAQDWKRLGAAADFFRPMCYDMHWPTSEAGPIAPAAWAAQVMKLAADLVDPAKIEMGVPFYGYDWKGRTSLSYDWAGFQQLCQSKGPARLDAGSQELTLSYQDRTVWFAGAACMQTKFPIARQAGARGLALWRLGSESPEFWDQFAKNR